MNTHIQVKNLNAYYGKQQALKNINIEIPRKQITVIMGPSGCGKTTLLKTLNRFFELNEDTRLTGEVLVDGENIHGKGVEVETSNSPFFIFAERLTPNGINFHGDNNSWPYRSWP